MLVLDSGAVTSLSMRSPRASALLERIRNAGLGPPVVLTAVLVECITGHGTRDAHVNRFLRTCDVVDALPLRLARRAAHLRTLAGTGSAVDALVVAHAEPHGTVLTGDLDDLRALARHAMDVVVEGI
jgi:hypothetical protein